MAGFWAKWYVIQSALQVGGWLTLLAVLTMLNAAIAAFYYLRVVVYMYMREAPESAPAVERRWRDPRRPRRWPRWRPSRSDSSRR